MIRHEKLSGNERRRRCWNSTEKLISICNCHTRWEVGSCQVSCFLLAALTLELLVNRMWKGDVNYFENKEKIYMEIDLCRYRMSSHVSAAKCCSCCFYFILFSTFSLETLTFGRSVILCLSTSRFSLLTQQKQKTSPMKCRQINLFKSFA